MVLAKLGYHEHLQVNILNWYVGTDDYRQLPRRCQFSSQLESTLN